MSPFLKELSDLCRKTAALAEASDDRRDLYSEMLGDLSLVLGRTIGIGADGRQENIARLLITTAEITRIEAEKTAGLRNLTT